MKESTSAIYFFLRKKNVISFNPQATSTPTHKIIELSNCTKKRP